MKVEFRIRKVYLFPSNTTLGWRVIRMVSMAEAEKREALGAYRRVYDGVSGDLVGFQLISPDASRVDRDLPSMHSSASISTSEMKLNAEAKSFTAGMPEDLRLERRIPEDRVERVQRKVAVWPHVSSAKGGILAAWPK